MSVMKFREFSAALEMAERLSVQHPRNCYIVRKNRDGSHEVVLQGQTDRGLVKGFRRDRREVANQ